MSQTKKAEAPESCSHLNVWQKLLEARIRFLESDLKKSGKHIHLEFRYFELEDIVPVATRIFASLGLLPVVSFTNELAAMTLINTDNPDGDRIAITSPMREIEGIVTKSGGKATTAIQNLGSVETYQRRYLYMIALDITENDSLDPLVGEAAPPAKRKAPATPEKQEEVAETLTNTEGAATELQVKQLKKAIARLMELDPTKEAFASRVAVVTDDYKNITKAKCEELLIKVGEAVANAEKVAAG